MKDLILLARALADSTRVRIIAALRIAELCTCELSDALELSPSMLSTHLRVIRRAGLVLARKQGEWMGYRLGPSMTKRMNILFGFYREAFAADMQLKQDAKRIHKRLGLRQHCCCVVGFGRLRKKTKHP